LYDETGIFSCNVGITFYNGDVTNVVRFRLPALPYLFIVQQKGIKATLFWLYILERRSQTN